MSKGSNTARLTAEPALRSFSRRTRSIVFFSPEPASQDARQSDIQGMSLRLRSNSDQTNPKLSRLRTVVFLYMRCTRFRHSEFSLFTDKYFNFAFPVAQDVQRRSSHASSLGFVA